MKTLDQLGIESQTDRASVFTRTWAKPHDYCRHYDKIFTPLRDKPVKLLEIGAAGGEGVRMWLEYFWNGRVFGVDIVSGTNPYNTPDSGIDTHYTFDQGDQSDPEFWKRFIAKHGGDWDVCIDDGGHYNNEIITSFNSLWPHVKPGGFYAIEDLGCSYGASIFVRPGHASHMEFIKGLLDEINVGHGIDSMYASKELVILRKAL